jgi:hypothetical protein
MHKHLQSWNISIKKQILMSICCGAMWQIHAQKAVICIPNTMVLYSGVPSPILMSYPGISVDKLELRSRQNCRVQYDSIKRQYLITAAYKVDSCSVLVGIKKRKHIVWKDTIYLRVKKLPGGEARLGSLKGNTYYSLDKIMEQDEITLYSDAYLTGLDKAVIRKFRVIIMPKKGYMEDYTVTGNKLGPTLKAAIARCGAGDMLVIDGIRVFDDGMGHRSLSPITYTISGNKDGHLVNDAPIRREGYFLVNGIQKHYVFPISENQEAMDFSDCVKDSIWLYYVYNGQKKDYVLVNKDSFKAGNKIYSQHFDDSSGKIKYKVVSITDTSFNYISYHPNGKLSQVGIAVADTDCKKYFKYKFHEHKNYPVQKNIIERYMDKIETPYSPIGEWKVYDSVGNIEAKIYYSISSEAYDRGCDYDNPLPSMCVTRYFRIIPNGCTLYSKDGKIQKEILIEGLDD